MRLPTLLMLSTAAALAAAAPAGAATITYEDDAVVLRAAPGEKNSLYLYATWPVEAGKVRFTDSGVSGWTLPAAGCTQVDDENVDCDIPGRIRVELGDGDDSLGFSETFTEAVRVEALGGDGDDRLQGNHGVAAVEAFDGGAGKDLLDGYGGDDDLRGGPGDDEVRGSAGNDQVRGEDGNDTLTGDHQAAPGSDLVDGGAGSDKVAEYVEYGTDVHPPADVSLDGLANDGRAGEGDNVVNIERYVAYVSGRFVLTDGPEDWQVWSNMSSGPSEVLAMGGADRVVGEDASETIDGGAGDDYVEGGKGHDTLRGGSGRDVVFGDDTDSSCNADFPESCVKYGNDVIDTRDGEADQVDCGAGTDKVLADAQDTVAANCETIERGAASGGPSGTPTGPGGAGPGGQPGTTDRPTMTVGRGRLAAILRKGFTVRVAGAAPGRAAITVRYGRTVVASGRATVSASGTATARVRFTKAGRRRLARVRRASLTIRGAGATAKVTFIR